MCVCLLIGVNVYVPMYTDMFYMFIYLAYDEVILYVHFPISYLNSASQILELQFLLRLSRRILMLE